MAKELKKIFEQPTFASKGGLKEFNDEQRAKGWESIGKEPPESTQFNVLQNDAERGIKYLYAQIREAIRASSPNFEPDEGKAVDLREAIAAKMDKSANFADVADKSKARGNLGLGTAATKNVGTGSGNVMEVGAFGLGGQGLVLNEATDASLMKAAKAKGSSFVRSNVRGPSVPVYGAGFFSTSQDTNTMITADYATANVVVMTTRDADADTPKVNRLYGTANKPTAADVNAYTKQEADGQFIRKTGDDYTGALKARGNGSNSNGEVRSPSGVFLPYADDGMRAEVYGVDVVGDHFEYRIVIVKNGVDVHYFSFRDDGRLSLPGEVNTPGNITAWDLKANGGVYDGGVRVYSRNNPPSVVNLSKNGWRKNEDGLIEQWGYVEVSNGEFNFPIPFPSECLNFMASNANVQGQAVDNAYGYANNNKTFTVATKNSVQSSSISNFPVYWTAKGK